MDPKSIPAYPPPLDTALMAALTPTSGALGMTLRDYFAAKAMHQLLHGSVLPIGFDASEQLAMLAARAYETADAMLAAR